MKVEVTLQFEVPDASDIDVVSQILRERIKDFDYYNELVQCVFITTPDKSILKKEDRLEHLERAVSAFKELLIQNPSDRSVEADQLLNTHHRNARETYYKNL
jgi:inorganic pyrophosphatase/exopolyphosphatase